MKFMLSLAFTLSFIGSYVSAYAKGPSAEAENSLTITVEMVDATGEDTITINRVEVESKIGACAYRIPLTQTAQLIKILAVSPAKPDC